MNAFCWTYNREDHQYLDKIGILGTLQYGDGDMFHPINRAHGKEETNFHLMLKRESEFNMTGRT